MKKIKFGLSYAGLYEELADKIFHDYGKKCREFQIGCIACQKWLSLDILLDCVDLEAANPIKDHKREGLIKEGK